MLRKITSDLPVLQADFKWTNTRRLVLKKNCFSAWASTLNMGLINEVDMDVCRLWDMVFS